MTRKQLQYRLIFAFAVLLLLVVAAVALRLHRMPGLDRSDERAGYGLIKDLAPLILGLLAVLLTSWYQQRMAFLTALRAWWSHLLRARTSMLAYLATASRSEEAYNQAYGEISRATDEVRTVYRNVGEDDQYIGYYPYEPVNDMRKAFEAGANDGGEDAKLRASGEIWDAWKALRWSFLNEFDAPEPTRPIVQFGHRDNRRRGPRPKRHPRSTSSGA
jgi:hypothetical protein